VSFTAQVPSWAEWAPPIPVLCLGHSVWPGFLCRNDVLILRANPEKIVCRIGREATQVGCWGEQVPSEIVIKMVYKSCHSPLWWAVISHSGRVSKDRLAPHLNNPGGLTIMCVTLRAHNRAGIMDGAPYVYRKCIWHSCLAC
jgi:hypothetical protein